MSEEPVVHPGETGPAVVLVQQLLVAAGFDPGPVDGDYRSRTETAVRAFQAARNLDVDGVIGRDTWAALKASPQPAHPTQPSQPDEPGDTGGPGDTGRSGHGGHSVSDVGLRLIQMFEGLSLDTYNDPAGHCTVGYGHLLHHGSCDGSESAVDNAGALRLLQGDAGVAGSAIDGGVTVALNQAQFDALTSFVFNVGAGNFEASTLRRQLNEGAYDTVPAQLNRWVHSDAGVLPGLVRRRAIEGKLFTDGVLTEIPEEAVFRLPKPIVPPDGP